MLSSVESESTEVISHLSGLHPNLYIRSPIWDKPRKLLCAWDFLFFTLLLLGSVMLRSQQDDNIDK